MLLARVSWPILPLPLSWGFLQSQVTVKCTLFIFKLMVGMGISFFGYAPGPDLACKASVQRAYLRNTVTTTLYSRSVAPGQAYDVAPYWVVSKWFIAP